MNLENLDIEELKRKFLESLEDDITKEVLEENAEPEEDEIFWVWSKSKRQEMKDLIQNKEYFSICILLMEFLVTIQKSK